MPHLTFEERESLMAIIEELEITAARATLRQFLAVMSKKPSVLTRDLKEILKDALAYNKVVIKKEHEA